MIVKGVLLEAVPGNCMQLPDASAGRRRPGLHKMAAHARAAMRHLAQESERPPAERFYVGESLAEFNQVGARLQGLHLHRHALSRSKLAVPWCWILILCQKLYPLDLHNE